MYANSYTCFALQLCVWVAGTTWGLSFAYYTCMVLPYKAFDYRYHTSLLANDAEWYITTMTICFNCSNDGLAGCAPVPQTGILMLVSTCLLYFPTTMTLLYVYGTVFHSHNSSQRLVPTTTRTLPAAGQSMVKTATRYECNDHCTEGYCNVTFSHARDVLIRIHNEIVLFFLGWGKKKVKVEEAVTRSVATMSLAFIINSTPWIIKQIIVACLGNEVSWSPDQRNISLF